MDDKNRLRLFMNDGGLDPTEKELRDAIEEESAKPVEEMDTELIGYCLDALGRMT